MGGSLRPEPDLSAEDFAQWQDFQKWKEKSASPTQTMTRQALKTPEGKKRLEAGNREQFEAEMPSLGDYLDIPRQTEETVAAGIPGVKLARSLVQAKRTGQPLADVQREVNDETSDVPYASAAGRMVGTMALTPFLPASGPLAGAVLGGADQALNNDPGSGLLNRAARTIGGATVGAAAGAVGDRLVTGGRSLLAGNAAKTRAQMLADRASSAADLYKQALSEGANKPTPKAVADFLQEPDIAEIVADLKGTRPFANVREDSPEMLDAIYKNLSDKAGMLKGKLGALTPRGANLGRVAQQDVKMAQGGLLDAVETPTPPTGFPNDPGRKALMPSYRKAVEDYAVKSKGIESFDTGYDALRTALSPNAVSAKNLTRANKTPEAFADLMATLGPEEGEQATQGILGMAKAHPGGVRLSSMGKAAKLLRASDKASGNQKANITQKGLLALLSSLTSP